MKKKTAGGFSARILGRFQNRIPEVLLKESMFVKEYLKKKYGQIS